jgi:hypothetical protein
MRTFADAADRVRLTGLTAGTDRAPRRTRSSANASFSGECGPLYARTWLGFGRPLDLIDKRHNEPITGVVAGVPITALSPTIPVEGPAPLELVTHMLNAPCSDAAFVAVPPLRYPNIDPSG